MNKTGFVCIAASAAALLCLSACADLDKLDGTRTSDNRPQPGALRAEAQASAQSATVNAQNSQAAAEKTQRK